MNGRKAKYIQETSNSTPKTLEEKLKAKKQINIPGHSVQNSYLCGTTSTNKRGFP